MDYTARYLQAQSRGEERVPVVPRLGAPGPRPALTRLVFTRDSIEWGNVETLGDLLATVPGVYLWRGGWIGRPEPVNYQGRGATSAEYFLDGVQFVAAGVDSVAVDPALFALSFLERVEVERWPGLLRVHLFTRRHDRVAPWSNIGVARGDADFARYLGALQRRFGSGIGFTLAGELLDAPTARGTQSGYKNTQVWVQGSYIPSARLGVQYQLVGMRPDREPYIVGGTAPDTIGLGFDANRTDAQFRGFWRAREDGLGTSVDLIYARTGWDGAGVKQQVNQLGAVVAWRTPIASLGGSAFYRTRWTSLDLRANAGWTPTGFFTGAAEAGYRRHDGSRSSKWIGLQAGIQLPAGFSVTGSTRLGDVVAAPAVETDTAQQVRDFRGELRWERGFLALEGALTRTSGFAPFPYAEFRNSVPLLAPVPATTWVTGGARVKPVGWITLDGWYSEPQGDPVDGVPSRHSLVRGTIRSRFLRTFPSGIFELKLQGTIESWGSGTIGREADGTPIPLPGATFFRSLIQIRLGSFSIYWDRANLTATERGYVPGFEIPPYGSTYGVRWDFSN